MKQLTVLDLTDESSPIWEGSDMVSHRRRIKSNQSNKWFEFTLTFTLEQKHKKLFPEKRQPWKSSLISLWVEAGGEKCIFLERGKQAVDTSVTQCGKRSLNNVAALNTQLQLSWEWISGWGCATFLWIQEQPPTHIYHLHSYGQYLENNTDTTFRCVSCRSEAPK